MDSLEPNLVPASKVRKPLPGMLPDDEKVKIILEENDTIPPSGLYLGLNGMGYLLRPGEEARVPPGIIEILEHAVMSAPVINPSTRQVIGYRDRMRYPFRRIHS